MAIAALYNVPGNPTELSQWAFAHMAHHRDINRVIYEQANIALPEFLLDPLDETDSGTWEYQHQLMHQAQDAVLGIDGYDLTGVKWQDPDNLAAWIRLNALEHYQAGNILGIG